MKKVLIPMGLILGFMSFAFVKPTKPAPAPTSVWYGSRECETTSGCGTECAITTDDESCELQTACTPNQSSVLSHFYTTLTTDFTATQITFMGVHNTPVTQTDLLQALVTDGFAGAIYPTIRH